MTTEDRIRMIIGDQIIQIAALTASLEETRKELADLKNEAASAAIAESSPDAGD